LSGKKKKEEEKEKEKEVPKDAHTHGGCSHAGGVGGSGHHSKLESRKVPKLPGSCSDTQDRFQTTIEPTRRRRRRKKKRRRRRRRANAAKRTVYLWTVSTALLTPGGMGRQEERMKRRSPIPTT
jgi:hypothetical protein